MGVTSGDVNSFMMEKNLPSTYSHDVVPYYSTEGLNGSLRKVNLLHGLHQDFLFCFAFV